MKFSLCFPLSFWKSRLLFCVVFLSIIRCSLSTFLSLHFTVSVLVSSIANRVVTVLVERRRCRRGDARCMPLLPVLDCFQLIAQHPPLHACTSCRHTNQTCLAHLCCSIPLPDVSPTFLVTLFVMTDISAVEGSGDLPWFSGVSGCLNLPYWLTYSLGSLWPVFTFFCVVSLFWLLEVPLCQSAPFASGMKWRNNCFPVHSTLSMFYFLVVIWSCRVWLTEHCDFSFSFRTRLLGYFVAFSNDSAGLPAMFRHRWQLVLHHCLISYYCLFFVLLCSFLISFRVQVAGWLLGLSYPTVLDYRFIPFHRFLSYARNTADTDGVFDNLRKFLLYLAPTLSTP